MKNTSKHSTGEAVVIGLACLALAFMAVVLLGVA